MIFNYPISLANLVLDGFGLMLTKIDKSSSTFGILNSSLPLQELPEPLCNFCTSSLIFTSPLPCRTIKLQMNFHAYEQAMIDLA